ncbi:MAG: hypothetical protein JXA28_02645 [Bacteroidetes bacterium]|nr:hypothetical protein [Bacteroidota bacterium]
MKTRRLYLSVCGLLMAANMSTAQVFIADSAEYRFAMPPDEVDLNYSPMGPSSLDSAAMSRIGSGDRELEHLMRFGNTDLFSLKEESDIGWREADGEVRLILWRFEGNPYVNGLRQSAASLMLWHYLLSDTVTAERQEAVAYYVDMMLNTLHPDADLLERALEYLSIWDTWSPERRAAAARKGAKHAREMMAKQDESLLDRVGLGDWPKAEEMKSLEKKRHYRIMKAVLRLEHMAENAASN